MVSFKFRKISPISQPSAGTGKIKTGLFQAASVLLFLFLFGIVLGKIRNEFKTQKVLQWTSSIVGKDLQTDAAGRTNILLLGVGGDGHEGGNLTDTIIIASIDAAAERIVLLSLPRDLYVDSTLGKSRINRLYDDAKLKWDSAQGLGFTRETIAKIFELEIPYYVKVDFKAAEDLVDALGGVEVFVEQEIVDTAYPTDDGTYGYRTFRLPAGFQHLDGKTALQYARSRHSTSDFDRSRRQQEMLIALKNKAASLGTLTSKRFIQNALETLKNHVETNLTAREILTLAERVSHANAKKLRTATLHDEPELKGGFLYTPARELFGGAYVLLPAGDTFSTVIIFLKTLMESQEDPSRVPIAILNGTKINGLAAKAKTILTRFGWNVVLTANSHFQKNETTLWYAAAPAGSSTLPWLMAAIPGSSSMFLIPEDQTDPRFANIAAFLVLGKDAPEILRERDIFRNIVPLVPALGSSTSAALLPAGAAAEISPALKSLDE